MPFEFLSVLVPLAPLFAAFAIKMTSPGPVIFKQIRLGRAGVPSVSISVPGRYPHTAVGLVHLDDWKNTLGLMYAALHRATPALLESR